ncbi:MAG: hypothetical protein JST31_05845 [Actinobacteria bacterium]|nr:hypothetical protein [Actinomycetota bacterium]
MRRGRKLWAGLAAAVAAGAVSLGAATGLPVTAGAAGASAEAPPAQTARAQAPGAFAWVRPELPAPGWTELRLPGSPARLPVPPGWRRAHGDRGTRTAELIGPGGAIVGYLNATPRQGRETLADWASFRVEHNRDEGDREVLLLAAARGLDFTGATGSCVLDSYRTVSGHRYREIACIVAGRSATTVLVAAAAPRRWAAERTELRRAVESFTT